MTETSSKLCSACGVPFGCGAALGSCWCSTIDIPESTAADLGSKYSDCLCPKCLAACAETPSMVISYPSGKVEIIAGAVRVDPQNFHEGMYDFYDAGGKLLRQIDMGSEISWEEVGTKLSSSK